MVNHKKDENLKIVDSLQLVASMPVYQVKIYIILEGTHGLKSREYTELKKFS